MTVLRLLKLRAEYPLRGSSSWSILNTFRGKMTDDDFFRLTKMDLCIDPVNE